MTTLTDSLRTLHRIHRQLADLQDRLQRGPKQIRAGEANVKKCEGGGHGGQGCLQTGQNGVR